MLKPKSEKRNCSKFLKGIAVKDYSKISGKFYYMCIHIHVRILEYLYLYWYSLIYTYTCDNTEQSRSRKKEVKENAGDVFSSKAQRKRAMMSWKVIAYFCKMELRSKMKSISLVFPHNHYLLCLTFPI